MNSNKLEDMKINVKIKLAILWTTLMFLYIYVDLVSFYLPGHIEDIMSGKVAGIQINQAFLLGVMILMTIPSVMVFLSLTLKAKVNRWVNIILGILHTGLALFIILPVEDILDYGVFGTIVEVMVLLLIVWYAWKWPTQEEVNIQRSKGTVTEQG